MFRLTAASANNKCSSEAPVNEFALERLPDELLLTTMSMLAAADLAAVAGVCRRFAQLSREESLWRVHVGHLTCRAPSQVSKPPSRSWCQHYRHLSAPPTFAAVCRDRYTQGVILNDCLYVLSNGEIVQYRVPAEPRPVDSGDIVRRRVSAAEDRVWNILDTIGGFLTVQEFAREYTRERRTVLLDQNLTVLQTIRPPSNRYSWLLFNQRLVAVPDSSRTLFTAAGEGSTTGIADQEIGCLPFPLEQDTFKFVATERSFAVLIDPVDGTGVPALYDDGVAALYNVHDGRLKLVEIGTARRTNGRMEVAPVLDEALLSFPLAEPRPAMFLLTSIDDAYLLLSVFPSPNARLDVFAVRTRRTMSLTLPSFIDDTCSIRCAPAPTTGLLYVLLMLCTPRSLWKSAADKSREQQPMLLFALNSSGACVWRTEVPRVPASLACVTMRSPLALGIPQVFDLRALGYYPAAVVDGDPIGDTRMRRHMLVRLGH